MRKKGQAAVGSRAPASATVNLTRRPPHNASHSCTYGSPTSGPNPTCHGLVPATRRPLSRPLYDSTATELYNPYVEVLIYPSCSSYLRVHATAGTQHEARPASIFLLLQNPPRPRGSSSPRVCVYLRSLPLRCPSSSCSCLLSACSCY